MAPEAMDPGTKARLRALNQSFYSDDAEAFDATRRHAWPGWERVPLPTDRGATGSGAGAAPLRVLDVGCGNARLASWLRERLGPGFEYVGVDASERMLGFARQRLSALEDVAWTLVRADVLDDDAPRALPAGPFDWVVCFGLLHHVPGRAARIALLAALAERVAAGGVLAFSAWQFADRARFAKRIVPWSAAAARLEPPLDPAALEPGDHLLRFADRPRALRYCHHCDEAEIDELIAGLPLAPRSRYSADGRSGDLNRYVVLVRDPR
jgi:tRNA (uracil-5-)-methyltransferase TRM9